MAIAVEYHYFRAGFKAQDVFNVFAVFFRQV
jgi:hypothetical protein